MKRVVARIGGGGARAAFSGRGVSAGRGGRGAAAAMEPRSGRRRAARLQRHHPVYAVPTGRGVERPNGNEFFPHGVDRTIQVIYYGAGARIPITGASTHSPTGD